jgi:glycosyltransferase involved in cell wall biosynthesis
MAKPESILIAPAHYLFSDKFGSESLWAVEIVKNLSAKVDHLDVIVGIWDTEAIFPQNVRIFPVFKSRSNHLLIELAKRTVFYWLVLWKYLRLSEDRRYAVVHHLLPLSFATVNPLVYFLKIFQPGCRVILGPLQAPQTETSVNDIGIALTDKKHNLFIVSPVYHLYRLAMIFVKPLSVLMFNISDTVICNSQYSKKYYQKNLKGDNLKVIHTGIPAPDPLPEIPRKSSVVRICCVGRLTPRKGQIYLLEAFKELIKTFPDIQLILVGVGDSGEVLKKFVNDYHLSANVVFKGQIPHSRIMEIYTAGDIFCLPSLSDPSPTVVLEAMSAGLPVVASDVGSVKEIVGEGGIMVEPQNTRLLINALGDLIRDRGLRTMLGKKAKNRILSSYTWDKITDQYVSLYT